MRVLAFAGSLILFCIPAALASRRATRLIKTSLGAWRWLVWLPVAPLAVWGPFVAFGVAQDSTSHNLWPFELAIWSLLSLGLFGLVVLARRWLGGARAG